MSWPQIIMIGLLGFGLGCSINDHGKPRKAENAWYTIAGSALLAALLWWGGFWS